MQKCKKYPLWKEYASFGELFLANCVFQCFTYRKHYYPMMEGVHKMQKKSPYVKVR